MFKRKLAALGFHHPDDFNANGNYWVHSSNGSDCIFCSLQFELLSKIYERIFAAPRQKYLQVIKINMRNRYNTIQG